MGESSPSGSSNSILVLGSSTKTTVTPWAGSGLRGGNLRTQHGAVDPGSPFEVGNGNGHVVQSSEHERSSVQ
jgi:hypothetical protein